MSPRVQYIMGSLPVLMRFVLMCNMMHMKLFVLRKVWRYQRGLFR